jgi:hypothetical protein
VSAKVGLGNLQGDFSGFAHRRPKPDLHLGERRPFDLLNGSRRTVGPEGNIRTSNGEIRWMDVSAYLKRESAGGKTIRQIIFAG